MKYKNFNIETPLFDYDNLKARFLYNFDQQIFFEEEIDYSSFDFLKKSNLDKDIIKNILFHISIATWISYYKLYPTENIIITWFDIDKESKDFWKKFYLNWLGEFFLVNNLNPEKLLNFDFRWDLLDIKDYDLSDRCLVPIWWWKDSIVSIELLSEMWIEFDLYTFWKENILYKNTQDISWKKRLITKRKLSDNLIDEIKKWWHNWHVPITWIIAFNMILISYIYDYKYLCLSNEKSANFWNTNIFWINVNHQWSKSLEFENDFNYYVSKNISSKFKYFSLLRPFYEICIAKLFSKYAKKYFKVFSSCNHNFKIFNKSTLDWWEDYWCKKCPKCVFVYSILSWFLEKNELTIIFWYDLFEDKSLEDLFRELLWIKDFKPLECVWEASEVILSLKYASQKYDKLPYILEMFKSEIDSKMSSESYKQLEEKLFDFSINESNIPKDIIDKMINIKI